MKNDNTKHGKVVLYKNRIEVTLEKNTAWLNQKQMAELFDKDLRTVNEHILNVYKEKELSKKSTIRKFRIVQKEGQRKVLRNIEFYNLDVIISVGYRVNSVRGTQFRVWATNVLRKHLIDGYTLNEKRLKIQKDKIRELSEAVALLKNVLRIESISDESKGIIQIISEYTKALNILDDYDHKRLKIPRGTKRSKYILTYEKARKIIDEMRRRFKDSPIVGQEKDASFKGSLGAIYQTFDGKDVYPTIEEKAAHLLYFAVKNHSFVDGNKRISAALFVCFLQKNGVLSNKKGEKRINDSTLVALALMIAASNPSEKDLMIKVILNLLGSK
ncbi:MAG: RhuM family protein [Candidatus Aadella gelida]|nr:RhuM family protein [Candidatus Aadella gelida]